MCLFPGDFARTETDLAIRGVDDAELTGSDSVDEVGALQMPAVVGEACETAFGKLWHVAYFEKDIVGLSTGITQKTGSIRILLLRQS